MSQSVLLMAIGPVQDFIGQARRSRDLWMGSHLLSEVSRAAAKALAKGGAELIFPALKAGDVELERCEGFSRPNGAPPVNVANKILALVPTGKEVALAREAREAAQVCFKEFARPLWERYQDMLAKESADAWNEQIDTLLEVYAVAVPILEGEDGYKKAREEAERALGARKNLRDFKPWKKQDHRRPKSSLDGARESVLPPRDERKGHLFGEARINENEQLSAVDLVKRRGGKPDRFVPVSNITMSRWLEAMKDKAPDAFKALQETIERQPSFFDLKFPNDKVAIEASKNFPYEAQILLESRWDSIFKERDLESVSAELWREWAHEHAIESKPDDLLDRKKEWRKWMQKHVGDLLKAARKAGLGAPYPYVACLVADGDRMGAALDEMKTIAAHQKFSEHLSEFAVKARAVVEHYHGQLLYAGGDDVVAVVCLPDALACAKALKELFEDCMRDAVPVIPKGGRPTLSVGVGIGHLMEDMGYLLDLGREAEKVAKGDGLPAEQQRDALGVVLDKRSGGKLKWRMQWSPLALFDHSDDELKETSEPDEPKKTFDPVEVLKKCQELLTKDTVPSKKIYEIRKDLARMPETYKVKEASMEDDWLKLLRADIARTLARSEAGMNFSDVTPGKVGLKVLSATDTDYEQLRREVNRWVEQMLIARALNEARVGEHGGKA